VKKMLILVACLVVLIGGGALTAIIPRDAQPEDMPGALVQSRDPEASVFRTTEAQTQQLVFLIIAITVSLGGVAVPLALLMWFLSRGAANAKATPARGEGSLETAE